MNQTAQVPAERGDVLLHLFRPLVKRDVDRVFTVDSSRPQELDREDCLADLGLPTTRIVLAFGNPPRRPERCLRPLVIALWVSRQTLRDAPWTEQRQYAGL